MKNTKFLFKLAITLLITSIICYTSTIVILINNNIDINFTNLNFNGDFTGFFHGKYISDNKEFTLDEIETISLESNSGNIHVVSWENETIKLDISGYIDKSFFSNATLDIYVDSNKILKHELKDSPNTKLSKAQIKLYVPKNYAKNIDINVNSADINVNNTNFNTITIHSKSGNINCSNSKYTSLTTQSNSGSISLNAISSTSISSQSTSGNIDFKSIDGELNFNTNSANIKGTISSLGKTNTFSTSSGDIDLKFSSNCSFNFSANTSSGDINNKLELDKYTSNKKDASGIYNDGTNTLKCSTHSGDIEISSF